MTVFTFTLRNVTDVTISNKDNLIVASGEGLEAHDGSHTMGELYEHRYALFFALCSCYAGSLMAPENRPWMSENHYEGLPAYPGYFVAGFTTENNEAITYHIPAKHWAKFAAICNVLPKPPWYDGHTSEDVLERLWTL